MDGFTVLAQFSPFTVIGGEDEHVATEVWRRDNNFNNSGSSRTFIFKYENGKQDYTLLEGNYIAHMAFEFRSLVSASMNTGYWGYYLNSTIKVRYIGKKYGPSDWSDEQEIFIPAAIA